MSFCQQDNCGRIVYQEYLPAMVRWRYPKENWQEIEADDSFVEQETGKCFVPYRFKFRYRVSPSFDWNYGATDIDLYPPFSNPLIRLDDQTFGEDPSGWPTLTVSFANYFQYGGGRYLVFFELTHRNAQGETITSQPLNFETTYFNREHTTKFLGYERKDGLPDDCDDCTFTVTNNGQTVYTETRIVCPEVEKLPARLNDVNKEIKVKKQPNLETIEINQNSIPSNCLNIYLKSNDTTNFVSQICSAPNAPPPNYQVICGCSKE